MGSNPLGMPRTIGISQLRVGLPQMGGRLLILFCALNLNGVGYLFLGVDRAASPLAAVAISIVLIARPIPIRHKISAAWIWFLAINFTLGLSMGLFRSTSGMLPSEVFKLLYSACLAAALLTHFHAARKRQELGAELRFTRNCLLASALATLLTPYLIPYMHSPPHGVDIRASGVFGNPNEAACAANLCLALTLAYSPAWSIMRASAVAIPIGAVMLTFSKTGALTLGLLLLVGCIIRFRRKPLAGAVAVLGVITLVWGTGALSHLDLLEGDRARRLDAVIAIAAGELDSGTTTGRMETWGLALDQAIDDNLIGGGLGSMNSISGATLSLRGIPQGAHNLFLQVLGESGLLAFLALIFAISLCVKQGIQRKSAATILIWATLLPYALGTHGVLTHGYFILGVCVAVAAVGCRENQVDPEGTHY